MGGKGGILIKQRTKTATKARAVVIIPARWAASRFPGKVLAEVNGRSLLAHVIEVCRAAQAVERVMVATDDRRIFAVAAEAGAEPVMTSSRLKSGSDRVAAVAESIRTPIIVNVQGDEYFDRPQILNRLVLTLQDNRSIAVATLARPISVREAKDPHLVKVVCDRAGRAIYFSRSVIPYYREPGSAQKYLGHIGIYAFRRKTLLEFAAARKTPLERAENLEQLRLLEWGIPISVVKTNCSTVGVDTPADLRHLRLLLKHKAGA